MVVSSVRGLNHKYKSRLFIVSEYVDATKNSTGYYWSKIIYGFSQQFNEIYVICPKSSALKIEKIPASVTFIPVNDIAFNKKGLVTRLIVETVLSLKFAFAIFRKVRRDDVVFSGTNPALLLIFISMLKVTMGFKWALLVHDVFPENLVAAKVLNKNSPLYRLTKYLFDKVYSSADALIAIGRDMLELLSMKTRQQNIIEYVPNWVDPKDVVPLSRDRSELLYNCDLDNKVVFQFFGNLGRLQGIENILDAIFLVKNKKAAFIFIGSGSEENLISNFKKNHPDINIIHIKNIPFGSNNIALASCDVAIVSLAEGMNGLAVPSKAYFSLAADKPLLVISEEDSELFRLLSDEKSIGWFCEASNPAKLAALIDNICNYNLRDIHGKPRAVLIDKYGYENAIQKYSKYICELMGR